MSQITSPYSTAWLGTPGGTVTGISLVNQEGAQPWNGYPRRGPTAPASPSLPQGTTREDSPSGSPTPTKPRTSTRLFGPTPARSSSSPKSPYLGTVYSSAFPGQDRLPPSGPVLFLRPFPWFKTVEGAPQAPAIWAYPPGGCRAKELCRRPQAPWDSLPGGYQAGELPHGPRRSPLGSPRLLQTTRSSSAPPSIVADEGEDGSSDGGTMFAVKPASGARMSYLVRV